MTSIANADIREDHGFYTLVDHVQPAPISRSIRNCCVQLSREDPQITSLAARRGSYVIIYSVHFSNICVTRSMFCVLGHQVCDKSRSSALSNSQLSPQESTIDRSRTVSSADLGRGNVDFDGAEQILKGRGLDRHRPWELVELQ